MPYRPTRARSTVRRAKSKARPRRKPVEPVMRTMATYSAYKTGVKKGRADAYSVYTSRYRHRHHRPRRSYAAARPTKLPNLADLARHHHNAKGINRNFVRTRGLIPDSLITKCKIDSDVLPATYTAGNAAGYIVLPFNNFNAPMTGIDPSLKPLGYNQISGLYEDFRVLGVKVHLEVYTVGADSQPMFFAIGYDQENASPAGGWTPVEIRENKQWKYNQTIPGRPSHLSWYLSTAKVFGVNKENIRTDADFTGSMNGPVAPSEVGNVFLYFRTLNGETQAYYFRVNFTLYVEFSGPKVLPDSDAPVPARQVVLSSDDESSSDESTIDLSKSQHDAIAKIFKKKK